MRCAVLRTSRKPGAAGSLPPQGGKAGARQTGAERMNTLSEKTIICRCEDLTVDEIRERIEQGYGSFEEIKRITRIGMGPCQGRTCRQHLLRELARAAGKTSGEIELPTFRPPTKQISFGAIGGLDHDQ